MTRPRISATGRLSVRSGPNGVHLFHPRSGLNVLLDEVEVPRANWSRGPRFVSVAVTNACDLACGFCYAPKSPAALPVEKLDRWFKELTQNGCFGVGFGGGEPTLYRELPRACGLAIDAGLAVSMTTHAHKLDRHLSGLLKGKVDLIRVSVDGTGAVYESIRSRPFSSVLSGLEVAGQISTLAINTVVNDKTVNQVDLLAELAASVGAKELLFLPERPVHGRAGISPESARDLREWILEYQGPLSLAVSAEWRGFFPHTSELPEEEWFRSYLHIDAQGRLKRSSFDQLGVEIGQAGILCALEELKTYPTNGPKGRPI